MATNGRREPATATGQRGFITRLQANADGVTDTMLRHRIKSGDLVKTGVRTFTSPLVPASVRGDLAMLIADIGDPVWIAGPTAGSVLAFDSYVLAPPFHLVTLRDRQVRRAGHIIHTTADLPLIDRTWIDGLPVTSASRTVIDLARSEPAWRLVAAYDSALRDGGTAEEFMHRRITALRSSGRFGIPKLLAAIEGAEITRGGATFLERRFLELVAEAGLPRPSTQVVLGKAQSKVIRASDSATVAIVARAKPRRGRARDVCASDYATVAVIARGNGGAGEQFFRAELRGRRI